MGETHSASPSAPATSSNKAKKKSQKRNSGKSKRKDDLRSDAGSNAVGQVQLTYINVLVAVLHYCYGVKYIHTITVM